MLNHRSGLAPIAADILGAVERCGCLASGGIVAAGTSLDLAPAALQTKIVAKSGE